MPQQVERRVAQRAERQRVENFWEMVYDRLGRLALAVFALPLSRDEQSSIGAALDQVEQELKIAEGRQ